LKQQHGRFPAGLRRLMAVALLAACAPAVTPPPAPDAPPPVRPPEPDARPATAVIGVIIPQTGSDILRQYGELVLQGVRLALADQPGVEVVVLDDRGDANAAAALIAELERRNVTAVIGPLLSEGLSAAIRGRSNPDLLVISPTSSDPAPPGAANAYSLNTSDAEGAAALARHAVRTGVGRVGLLYPAGVEQREVVAAFRAALTEAGGRVVAETAYPVGTTTFVQQMRTLRAANPQAVFVAASERDIRQIAPQIEYYGLNNVRVLGSEAWGSDAVLRGVSPRVLEGVLTTTPLLPTSNTIGWREFVGRYEAAHRRTLDNPYPALGFDAANLVLGGLTAGRARPADVSRSVAAVRDYRGATGVLTVRNGAITRRPFLVRIENGRLVPAPGSTD
jgi:ABC-type branched-subunit amino acid transport system substrate-binding protein